MATAARMRWVLRSPSTLARSLRPPRPSLLARSLSTSRSKWPTARVRSEFLAYFAERGHAQLPSSSLVPAGDSSLLFTNSGMVQFKDWFAGAAPADAPRRVVTAQRCVRAGGKHNDLDNVGVTARHQTFFEMLGSFSFGGYGSSTAEVKREAIPMAWEFLTERVGLPAERLMVTVHEDDAESLAVWRNVVGLAEGQIQLGREDNRWSMGRGAGPCGLCTEIFWDQRREVDGERWLELWNVVFMQELRDAEGNLSPLPTPCVDTGMGLERLASVLQGVPSNYHTDALAPIVEALSPSAEEAVRRLSGEDSVSVASRVVADHFRAVAFLLADGVRPAATGRGYVLRRIIRRAVRHADKARVVMPGRREPFLSSLFPALDGAIGASWPHLRDSWAEASQLLQSEERLFLRTMERGMQLLGEELSGLEPGATLPGSIVFRLYDTFGFPFDLTEQIAREQGYFADLDGAESRMMTQRDRSKASGASAPDSDGASASSLPSASVLCEWQRAAQVADSWAPDYSQLSADCVVLACEENGDTGAVWAMLNPCPFFATGGGQVSDVGALHMGEETMRVLSSESIDSGGTVLRLEAGSQLQVGDRGVACVDARQRQGASAHHTATHLLNSALRDVTGDSSIRQAGSLVTPNRLRFDFASASGASLTAVQLRTVEQWVCRAISLSCEVSTTEMPLPDALALGAQAEFGEAYGDVVRVVDVVGLPSRCTELCGGTHVGNTEDLQSFAIVKEQGIAAGTRRIYAVTGSEAVDWHFKRSQKFKEVEELLSTPEPELLDRVAKLVESERSLRKQRNASMKLLCKEPGAPPEMFGGISLHVIAEADEPTAKLRAKSLKQQEGVHVLLCGAKIFCICGSTDDSGDARAVLSECLSSTGGRGGGSRTTAQGIVDGDGGEAYAKVTAYLAAR